MKVIVGRDVFQSKVHDLDLHAIAGMVINGRHRIFVDQSDAPEHFDGWLSAQHAPTRELWELALNVSIAEEPLQPAMMTILVTASENSNFDNDVPLLNMRDAIKLLNAPFKILVENKRNDCAFLLRMATPGQRGQLHKKLEDGFLIFENGGGISEIAQLMKTAEYSSHDAKMRTFVLTDSDALYPGEPSQQSIIVHQLCSDRGIRSHRLSRRNIENYIPLNTIFGLAGNSSVERRRATALKSLNADQRAHYNMKDGFSQDRKNTGQSARNLYAGLSPNLIQDLESGFGRGLAKCYSEEGRVSDDQVDGDGSRIELLPVVSKIIEALR